ncbi:MAG TPA: PRC-barrel domain-containing protein [Rubrobacter sp.]|nr:PRC-barrel domain-containing protein [Rubrobacter sp.]
MASEERLRELEEKYEGYTVYDNQGSKIGKVDDLFVDEKDHEEYIGVKLGLLGRKSTLIPTEIVRVNESDRTIEVSESKDHVKEAPSFDDDEDVTSEYEERIRSHFGLESLQGGSSGSYGATSGTATSGTTGTAAGAAASSGTSEHDEGHTSGSSGYAPEGAGSGSSGETYAGDREGSSGTDSEYRENEGATAPGLGSSEGTSGTGYYEQSGGSGETRERSEASGSSGMTGGTGQSSSGSQPGVTKQTEETETFQEGGRTKIRRRVIREEVVDADDQGSSS